MKTQIDEYLISEETKSKKRTRIIALRNYDEPGLRVKKTIETLDEKGNVKTTKKEEVYCPEKRIVIRTTGRDNPDIYSLSGGKIIWHGQH